MRIALAALLLAALSPAQAHDPAPPFALTPLDGRTVRSESLAGRLVILNLWATWCMPCRQELKELDAFAARHGDRVAIFAIDMGGPATRREVAIRARTLGIPVAGFATGAAAYRPIRQAIPTTYVIAPDGGIVASRAGALAPGELERLTAPYLPVIAPVSGSEPSGSARRTRSADRP